jgi:hypothetical protein
VATWHYGAGIAGALLVLGMGRWVAARRNAAAAAAAASTEPSPKV